VQKLYSIITPSISIENMILEYNVTVHVNIDASIQAFMVMVCNQYFKNKNEGRQSPLVGSILKEHSDEVTRGHYLF